MKVFKKLSTVLLTLCLCVFCFSIVAQAADGRISFTDPSTAVGDMVEVKCVVRSTSGNIGNLEVKLNYDKNYLRFDSGDGVKVDGDALTYTGSGSSTEASFTVKFQALKEGSTQVSVAGATIASDAGAALTFDQGNSTVQVAAGDPSKIKTDSTDGESSMAADKTVEVNGKSYTLTDEFADNDIPSGYSRVKVSLDGEKRQMVKNEDSGVKLAYLLDSDKKGDFFIYDADDATFSPYEEITISDSASIVVLSDAKKVNLPSNYKEAKLTLNGKEFPVWQNGDSADFYVLYALNNKGEAGYYQYDSQENTYQRMDDPSADTEKKDTTTKKAKSKLPAIISNHLEETVFAAGIIIILLLLLAIILRVKLHNRNAELDELYDEFGIDEEKEPATPAKKEKLKKSSRFGKKEEAEEDEFESYDEDEFEYADNEDTFDEDAFDEEEFAEADYEDAQGAYEDAYADAYDNAYEDSYEDIDDTYDDYDEDDFGEITYEEEEYGALDKNVFAGYAPREELTIDDLDDLLGEEPTTKKKGHMEEDDTFKVDFIDLD